MGTTGVTLHGDRRARQSGAESASGQLPRQVKDVTPPSFDLAAATPGAPFVPSNPAEATGPAGAVVSYTNPSASDSNGGPVDVVCASSSGTRSGSIFPIGTTPINCVATDESGNSTPPTNLFEITLSGYHCAGAHAQRRRRMSEAGTAFCRSWRRPPSTPSRRVLTVTRPAP